MSSVRWMGSMFFGASSFNKPIGDWNVSSVIDMNRVFSVNKFQPAHRRLERFFVNQALPYVFRSSVLQPITCSMGCFLGHRHERCSTPPLAFPTPIRVRFTRAFLRIQQAYDWSEFVTYMITDANFQDAVNLWFSDEANATSYLRTHSRLERIRSDGYVKAFMDRSTFNEDISGWGVGNVTKMNRLFKGASSFNQPIGDWDMSSVRWMGSMFFGASSFNNRLEIGAWTSVIDMNPVFSVNKFQPAHRRLERDFVNQALPYVFKAQSFNQSLAQWDVSLVTDMREMFNAAVGLSDSNKGEIHKSFSSNSNWPYDWSEFVTYTPNTDANFSSPDFEYHTPDHGQHSPISYTTAGRCIHEPGPGNISSPDIGYHTPDHGHQSPDFGYHTPDDGYGSRRMQTTPRRMTLTTRPIMGTKVQTFGYHSPDHGFLSPDDHFSSPDFVYQTPKVPAPDPQYVPVIRTLDVRFAENGDPLLQVGSWRTVVRRCSKSG